MDVFVFFTDFVIEVGCAVETKIRLALGADTSEKLGAVLSIGGWLNDADFVTAFFVVERYLEELHGLATTHGSISKI